MSAYREPAVNMYDQQQPIASRGDCDLMQIERGKSGGWIAQVRCGPIMTTYVSEGGIVWFEELTGDRVADYSTIDRLLNDRVKYLEAMRTVGR